ncbi:MAG TPA: SpoIIE family protein phosphatase, partial [Leptospiraceae bacterium]|nr:SpoIIE family protein phosphatase [Leptospiraceae bacterium]
MMISAIIGLLDGQTGCTYFINAEHPSPVLFREGQVTFAANGQSCFKLGSPMQATSARVFTMRLLPGDVLICGSDGRDDLRLADSAGINTDETLFLRLVADANGDLNALEDTLRRTGEIMDDLSLIRIAYKGHRSEESEGSFDREIENFLKQTRRQRRKHVDD